MDNKTHLLFKEKREVYVFTGKLMTTCFYRKKWLCTIDNQHRVVGGRYIILKSNRLDLLIKRFLPEEFENFTISFDNPDMPDKPWEVDVKYIEKAEKVDDSF